jgi:hypothetical protein
MLRGRFPARVRFGVDGAIGAPGTTAVGPRDRCQAGSD